MTEKIVNWAKNTKYLDSIIIGLIAFTYYLLLCSKSFTWVFVSSDSGDWLAGSIWWMNVQPFGSPLYIALGHLCNLLFPDHLVQAMTIGLSVIPASITVAITYLIAKKMTNWKLGLISAVVLLGATIFLSQATVLEEYAISSMFVTLALWFYINDHKNLTILMLALGSAVHIIVVMISIIWLALHIKELKQWYKTFWIYIVFGLLPYLSVPLLMYLDTPKLLAGYLSLGAFNSYYGSSGTVGSISWFEFLYRIPQMIGIFSISLGFALIPLFIAFKRPFTKVIWLMVATICFNIWLYATDTDPSTWTFMNFSFPMICVLVSLGLNKMKPVHAKLVLCSSIVLILANSYFMNANLITKDNSIAQEYEQALKELPDGSAIVTCSGGGYGLGILYVMAQGKDIVPIYYSGSVPDLESFKSITVEQYTDRLVQYELSNQNEFNKAINLVQEKVLNNENAEQETNMKVVEDMLENSDKYKEDTKYQDYLKWLSQNYDVQGINTQTIVSDLLNQGRNVYILKPTVTPYWKNVFECEMSDDMLIRVNSVN